MLLACTLLTACGGDDSQQGGPPPVAVNVAAVPERSIVEWDDFTGRIQAVDTVEIIPRISGYMDTVHFREGAIVDKGELLFTIDDREYKAAVASREADVKRAETRVSLAKQDFDRAASLRDAKAISAEELEQRQGELRSAEADLNAAKAALDVAALNLEFTQIRSPIRGRAGEALPTTGSLVASGQTLLTTVVSIDPVHVIFEGDEQIYLKYQAKAAEGTRPSSRDVPNPVQVGLASDADYPFRGYMDFVDNRVDAATGTIQGRALIDNPDGYLIPGLFARVRLLGSGEFDALLIHETAVLTDQDRKFVYVATDDNIAVRRDITIGREIDGLRVVRSGLEAGEKIVVNGVRKIFFSGAPIEPTVVPMNDPQGKDQANTSGTEAEPDTGSDS